MFRSFGCHQESTACWCETIICQKPFCRSLEQAREAVALAEEAQGLRLIRETGVHFVNVFRYLLRARASFIGSTAMMPAKCLSPSLKKSD